MSNKISLKSKENAYIIAFLSLSIVFSYVEAILPINVGNLGVKIGLANIVTIISLKILDIKSTLIINVLRLIIIGMLFGNLTRFILSFSGFLLSFIVMVVLLKYMHFSIITTSIFGGAFHNIGQILSLSIITKNIMILSLIPIYIIIGIITGSLIGVLSNLIYRNCKM